MLQAYIGYLLGAGLQLLTSLGYAPLPGQHRPAGQGAAQQDRRDIESVRIVTQADPQSDRLVAVSTVARADPAGTAGSARALSERRPLGDRSFQVLALASGLLVLVILVLIAISTSQQASSWFSTEGVKIFSRNWNPPANQFGALAFIYGTASRR